MTLVVVLLLGSVVPAFAYNSNFDFYISMYGYQNSSLVSKDDGEQNWYVTPKQSLNGVNSTWLTGERLDFRTLNSTLNTTSNIYQIVRGSNGNYGTTFNRPYLVTAYAGNSYALRVDKPDPTGGISPVNLVGTWCP